MRHRDPAEYQWLEDSLVHLFTVAWGFAVAVLTAVVRLFTDANDRQA